MEIIGVVGVVLTASILLWYGLRGKAPIQWGYVVAGTTFLILGCIVLLLVSSIGSLGPVVAFVFGLVAALSAISAGIVLAIVLEGKRRLAGLAFAIVLPIGIVLSINYGDSLSPESEAQSRGRIIADALVRYQLHYGQYPDSLHDLVPNYLPSLRSPDSMWGWLYHVENDQFYLGFVGAVERLGYSIYLYKSQESNWDFIPYSSEPFSLPPTPSSESEALRAEQVEYVPLTPTLPAP